MFRISVLACLTTALLGGCGSGQPQGSAFYIDGNGAGNWPGYGNTYGEQHYSPLTEINRNSVGKLGLMWSLDLGSDNSATQPIAVNDSA